MPGAGSACPSPIAFEVEAAARPAAAAAFTKSRRVVPLLNLNLISGRLILRLTASKRYLHANVYRPGVTPIQPRTLIRWRRQRRHMLALPHLGHRPIVHLDLGWLTADEHAV